MLHIECEKLMKASGKRQISDYSCFIFGNKMTYEKLNVHNLHLDLFWLQNMMKDNVLETHLLAMYSVFPEK